MTAPTYEGPVAVLHRVPVRQLSRKGRLRVGSGVVQLVVHGERVLAEGPVGEWHSWAPLLAEDFHLWHGSDRYRLCALGPVTPARSGPHDAAVEAPSGRPGRDQWGVLLRPVVAPSPPPGVRVRPPWPPWAWWASLVATAVALMAFLYLWLPY